MSDPKKQPINTSETELSDDDLYVSPTSNDTAKERYEKVRAREAQMTNEERLAAIRNSFSFFEDEEPEND